MKTYQIFQVPFESDLRRDVMFYDEDSTIYNQTDAKNAYTGGEYKYVGDIIVNQYGRIFIVAPCGFDELFAERAVA